MEHFVARSAMPASAEAVWSWHSRPGAFERLVPPWQAVRLLERQGGIEEGGRVVLAVRAGGRWRRWVAEHRNYQAGRQFCDVQLEGPFRFWRHCHRVVPGSAERCSLEDDIEYALPLGRVGNLLGGATVQRALARIFRYRHEVTAHDLLLHQKYSTGRAMKIAVSGSTGLVGSALVPFLTTGGHSVTRLVRGPADGAAVAWDPSAGVGDPAPLEGLDAVIHLAGENIAARRWNAEQKARIRDSRVRGTAVLCEALARLRRPPRVLLSASAVGFYGDRGDETLTETSAAGRGFLPEVCSQWEAATASAQRAGIRVVHLRFGIILSARGGALAKMLPPFRLGLGGRMGNGRQWMSWIALDDAVGGIAHALAATSLHGPLNVVAPGPATNREFTRILGRVLRRPTAFAMPRFAVRQIFGEMADELLLASTRVVPQALLESGFSFQYGDLEGALRHELGIPGKGDPPGTDLNAATERPGEAGLPEAAVGMTR